MGLILNKDGTATLAWKKHRVELPTPTLEEYGDIMDELDQMWNRDHPDLEEKQAEIKTEMETADVDRLEQLRKESLDLSREYRRRNAAPLIRIVGILASPEEAELFALETPSWANSPKAALALVGHFNTVPFDGPEEEAM